MTSEAHLDDAASAASGDSPRLGRTRRRVLLVGLLAAAIGVIQPLRARLFDGYRRGKNLRDSYALPGPKTVVALSLGYRSALADLLFAHVLVSSGIHLTEKRRFETAGKYLETINELDPKFATPYRFADTILTVQVTKPTLEDYVDARAILERGTRERPYDMDLWMSAGQFMVYLAAPHVAKLAGEAVGQEWKHQGALFLARSCELVGKDENAPHHCIGAASLLSKAGELTALRRFVERVVAANDDPQIQNEALAALSRAEGEQLSRAEAEHEQQRVANRRARYDHLRSKGLSFVGKDRFLLLGPSYDPFVCLGAAQRRDADCATSLAEYHRRMDELQQ